MTFTREQLQQIIETDHVQCGDAAALARELLESRVDAEPVARDAIRYRFLRDKDAFGEDNAPGLAGWDDLAELDAGDFDSAVDARIKASDIPLYTRPQPAPVVEYPDTLPCPVELKPGLVLGKGVKTQLLLNALQRRAEYYAELEAMTPEQRAEHDAGIKDFAAMLQGKAEPVIQGDELPAKCWCHTCRPVTLADMRFVVCPDCGNKRCPHANDNRNVCTGSNEPGQEGSAYPAATQQEAE